MIPKTLSFLAIPLIVASMELRNHQLQNATLQSGTNQCNLVERTTKSYNNNCAFRYTACSQSSNQIKNVIDCTYCEGQKNCPYLKYLGEVECIEKCCPFQSFFLSSMSEQRLQSCILFTEMERASINWVHSEFFFPFLIALIVLLIMIVIFLLVKTVVHLWGIYVKHRKRNQNPHQDQIHDHTTQENDRAAEWVYED